MLQTTFIGKDKKKHNMKTQWYPIMGATYVIFDDKNETQGGITKPEVQIHMKLRKDHKWIKEESSQIPGKPVIIKSCWDNDGVTMDRFTIFLKSHEYAGKQNRNKKFWDCLGLSTEPESPQGFSQMSSGLPGKHLGKRIGFYDLPINVIQHVVKRLTLTGDEVSKNE